MRGRGDRARLATSRLARLDDHGDNPDASRAVFSMELSAAEARRRMIAVLESHPGQAGETWPQSED